MYVCTKMLDLLAKTTSSIPVYMYNNVTARFDSVTRFTRFKAGRKLKSGQPDFHHIPTVHQEKQNPARRPRCSHQGAGTVSDAQGVRIYVN